MIPRSVAEVLEQHVTLKVEGIDRMYLNAYYPGCRPTEARMFSSAAIAERPSRLRLS